MRLFVGTLLSWFYNNLLTFFPSRLVRNTFLKFYVRSLGAKSNVQMRCRFLNGRKVTFGERNVVNFGCLFDGRIHPIEVGNDVSIGPEAVILTLGHDPQSPTFENKGGPVRIGRRVWIGCRAMILPGVTIGEGAVVALSLIHI